MTRPKGSQAKLEARRKMAITLLEQGHGIRKVADIFDVSPGSVSRWKQTYEEDGIEGLDAEEQDANGRPRKLSEAQLGKLEECLQAGAKAHGYETDEWTVRRTVAVIKEVFDTDVSKSTAWNYLQELDWTYQSGRCTGELETTSAEELLQDRWIPTVEQKEISE